MTSNYGAIPMNFSGKWITRSGVEAMVEANSSEAQFSFIGSVVGNDAVTFWDSKGNNASNREWDLMERVVPMEQRRRG